MTNEPTRKPRYDPDDPGEPTSDPDPRTGVHPPDDEGDDTEDE